MFSAMVKFPEREEPVITELIWQLYAPDGNEKTKLRKRIQLFESGKELPQEYGPITINARNLKNGEYKVALTHRFVEEPETYFQDIFPFKLFEAIRIKKVLVTADPEIQKGRSILSKKGGQKRGSSKKGVNSLSLINS
ncbi:MAG: hypothetical protein ACE5GV_09140 [Candidatus Scalindua sp.]